MTSALYPLTVPLGEAWDGDHVDVEPTEDREAVRITFTQGCSTFTIKIDRRRVGTFLFAVHRAAREISPSMGE